MAPNSPRAVGGRLQSLLLQRRGWFIDSARLMLALLKALIQLTLNAAVVPIPRAAKTADGSSNNILSEKPPPGEIRRHNLQSATSNPRVAEIEVSHSLTGKSHAIRRAKESHCLLEMLDVGLHGHESHAAHVNH